MSINNETTAKNPLQPVAESVLALVCVVQGVIERKGKGTFMLTEKGQGLQDALKVVEEANPTMTDEQRVRFTENWLAQNP